MLLTLNINVRFQKYLFNGKESSGGKKGKKYHKLGVMTFHSSLTQTQAT